jgi:hypothetical protein
MPLDSLDWVSVETALHVGDYEICPLIPTEVPTALKETMDAIAILQHARGLIVRGFTTGKTHAWGNRYCTLGALAKVDFDLEGSRALEFPLSTIDYGWSPAGIRAKNYLRAVTGYKDLWRWNDRSIGLLCFGRFRVLRGFNEAILAAQREVDLATYHAVLNGV